MAAEIALAGIAGGVVALIVVALVDPQGRIPHLDTVGITVGVFAGIGLDRLLRG